MLLQLNIKNFALIEDLNISFESGFNILSGETGAGKSILVDAISYVLGSKFNKNLIRTGKNKTFVEAVFTIENTKTFEMLQEEDISADEGMVIISRESFQSGRTIAKVNGKSMLISDLKKVSETLLDIHGQHDSQNLLVEENHISYLDYYGENFIYAPLRDYREKYRELNTIKKKIYEISQKNQDKDKIIDFLKYQIDEINSANLIDGEEEKLNEKFKIFSNKEKINTTLSDCYTKLYSGYEGNISIHDSMGVVIKQLGSIKDIMPEIEPIYISFENIYYELEGNIEDLRSIKDNFYYDVNELEYINNRLHQINNLKNKYGDTIKDIINYRDKIKIEYDNMENTTHIIEKLNQEKIKLQDELKLKSRQIHETRNKIARELEKNIKNELDFIGLEKSKFKIQIDFENKFNINGMDSVKFYISTNPGEPLKPLDKIVSGGELSRIMLALKTIFIDKDFIPSVIFDEIDTGISGSIAQRVAEKMYKISKRHQVFCITHLPQIACMSDAHYWVSKQIINNMTYTQVKKMDKKEKEYEIAKMIGGSEVTKITLEHARELINMADLKKDKIK